MFGGRAKRDKVLGKNLAGVGVAAFAGAGEAVGRVGGVDEDEANEFAGIEGHIGAGNINAIAGDPGREFAEVVRAAGEGVADIDGDG